MGKGAILEIEIKPAEREPIFLALARAITEEIERGRLKPSDPLPGTRALALSLNLNRNTVDAAYHELTMQGWLATEPSRGTFVATDLPDIIQRAGPLIMAGATTTARRNFQRAPLNLSDGSPDVRLVPTTAFAQAFRRSLHSSAFVAGGVYGDPRGSPALREALSIYLREERGLTAPPEDILITRGSQMALFLAATAIVEPGVQIAVERPGYPLAWSAFRAAGATVVGVPVDASGLDVEALDTLAQRSPRLRAVYVTPHHQYPTTVTLGAARRLRLLDIARRHNLVIIEDDYDNEYRFDGRPVLPLAARADERLPIIYVGSLSKLLAPGIRVGYAVASPRFLMPMADRREAIDRQGDLPLEHALAELISDGTIRRHARKARRIYHRRRDHLANLLSSRLADVADYTLPAGGLAIWLRLHAALSAETWALNAESHGLTLLPGIGFDLDTVTPPEAFRLGYAALDEGELERALDILVKSRPDIRRRR